MKEATPETIVFVLWEGLHVVSGVTSWVGALRPHLERRGYQVRVIVVDPSRDQAVLGKPDGVFVSLQQLKDLLKPFSPGIVVLMNVLRHSAFGPVIASLNRQGCRLHAISVVHSDEREEYYSHIESMAPWVRHIIAVSPVVAEKTRAALPEGSSVPVSTLPCGVDYPAELVRHYQANPIRLVYVGRLIQKQKRVRDLAALAGILTRRGVPFTLTIYGEGIEEPFLREQCAESIRSGRVVLGGRLIHGELLQRLPAHEVFVNTSEYEGTCVAMLEAMARGCVPVVTRASSGVEGVVEQGRNGFHVPVGDMEQLATRIAELTSSPGLIEKLGAEARRTVEQDYAMTRYAERFANILASIYASEPIRTSDEAERILASLLPVEAHTALRTAFADWQFRYIDSQLQFLGSRVRYLDSQVANLRITARIEKLVAPPLRRLKRALLRQRDG